MDQKQVIAPVENAIEDNYEVPMDLREFQPEVEEYYRAVDAGEAVPFRLATRQVMNARQYRLPTNQEPCRWSQVFRRVTRDLATKEVLQDLRKDQQEADFNWTSFIPNGPKDTEIEFFYNDVVEDAAPALDLVPQHAQEENLELLDIPQRPDLETTRKHELTHAEFASWCEHCVAARGRGVLHKVDASVGEDDRYEFDYTYWSHAGLPTEENTEQDSAAVSLTAIQRRTAMPMASIVVRKGPWPYAIAVFGAFVAQCARDNLVILRGDGEAALQVLLREVGAKLQHLGKTVKVESTPVGSHQSIGGAERCHQSLGNISRTLLHVIKEKDGRDRTARFASVCLVPQTFLSYLGKVLHAT